MTSRSFASVGWVATVAGAALGCYLVSLRVAAERAALETVQQKIVLAQRDIRLLQTEIGTRGRLAQLERWNVRVLALAAPKAEQFLDGGFALAKLTRPRREIDLGAPVVLASAPAPLSRPIGQGQANDPPEPGRSARDMLYTASLRRESSAAAPAPTPVKLAGRHASADGGAATGPAARTAGKTTVRSSSNPAPRRAIAGTAADPLAPISSDTTAKDSSTLQ